MGFSLSDLKCLFGGVSDLLRRGRKDIHVAWLMRGSAQFSKGQDLSNRNIFRDW